MFNAAVIDQQDASIVLAGHKDYDFHVVKLDAEGLFLWQYEVRFVWVYSNGYTSMAGVFHFSRTNLFVQNL